jgi:hypothetical protein
MFSLLAKNFKAEIPMQTAERLGKRHIPFNFQLILTSLQEKGSFHK